MMATVKSNKSLSLLSLLKFKVVRIFLVFVIMTPFYMYFSNDPAKLNKNYPFVKINKDAIEIEWTDKKPRTWTTLNSISKSARWAIVLSEDWSFYQHEGVDFEELKKALDDSLKEGRLVRGASTISQQVVKNVFLSHSRSLWRKAHEFILTYKMEKVVPKSKILETYFNIVEFGPNIYGIHQASYHYFGKHPSALNPREGSFLAMLLPSPKRYYISFKNKKLSNFARYRIKANLRKLKWGRIITEDERIMWEHSRFSWELP
jgi:monofunctional biosynthetic peptidoglycan transglycosylase